MTTVPQISEGTGIPQEYLEAIYKDAIQRCVVHYFILDTTDKFS